jgi:imidazolonepropionase
MITYRKISCLITNSGMAAIGGVRPKEEHLGILRNAALVFHPKKGVVWSGPESSLPKQFKAKPWKQKDCRGLTAYPGLVDPHTHPVFAGNRAHEFALRMAGATYQEIAAAGGGILHSMEATRRASAAELKSSLEKRLAVSAGFGIRLQEAKSGYGLDPSSEIKSLKIIRACDGEHGVKLVATCLAAHAVPPEHKANRQRYVDEVVQTVLPRVARQKLADYVDVFCDQGYFSVEESITIVKAAYALGLSARLHGEELGQTGIAEVAAALGVHSVDHLLKVSDKGILAMAKAGTVGVLLPATAFYLKESPAPARKLIDQGVPVALASDFNPGSSPTQNLPFVGSIAAIQLGMTIPEIIAGLTWNGARSLRKEKEFGSLCEGALGVPAFAEGDHPAALFYRLAPASLPEPANLTL